MHNLCMGPLILICSEKICFQIFPCKLVLCSLDSICVLIFVNVLNNVNTGNIIKILFPAYTRKGTECTFVKSSS